MVPAAPLLLELAWCAPAATRTRHAAAPGHTRGGRSLSPLVPVALRYDFTTVHPVAKGNFVSADIFFFGLEPLNMLLWFGDLKAMRTGVAKVLDCHRKVFASVQQGEATAVG